MAFSDYIGLDKTTAQPKLLHKRADPREKLPDELYFICADCLQTGE